MKLKAEHEMLKLEQFTDELRQMKYDFKINGVS